MLITLASLICITGIWFDQRRVDHKGAGVSHLSYVQQSETAISSYCSSLISDFACDAQTISARKMCRLAESFFCYLSKTDSASSTHHQFFFSNSDPEEVSRWEKQDYSHYSLPLFNYCCLCAFQQAPIPKLFLRRRACNCCCESQSSEQTCLKYGLKWRSAAEANVSRLQTARRCLFSPRISQDFEAGINRAMLARSPESQF